MHRSLSLSIGSFRLFLEEKSSPTENGRGFFRAKAVFFVTVCLDKRKSGGIDLRNGCHDITICDIMGGTGDDIIALTALCPENVPPRASGALSSTHNSAQRLEPPLPRHLQHHPPQRDEKLQGRSLVDGAASCGKKPNLQCLNQRNCRHLAEGCAPGRRYSDRRPLVQHGGTGQHFCCFGLGCSVRQRHSFSD